MSECQSDWVTHTTTNWGSLVRTNWWQKEDYSSSDKSLAPLHQWTVRTKKTWNRGPERVSQTTGTLGEGDALEKKINVPRNII